MSLDFRKFWSVDWILFKNILIKDKDIYSKCYRFKKLSTI